MSCPPADHPVSLMTSIPPVAAASAIVYLTHNPAPRRSGQANKIDEFSPVGRTYHMIRDRYHKPIDAAEQPN